MITNPPTIVQQLEHNAKVAQFILDAGLPFTAASWWTGERAIKQLDKENV